ncbi:unnamed protein product [Moneuplotes crassus]|uniref:Uncharacterized protein n=1 Tax=Euplotes crassus TaxID=5936 RepID=A0AAD1UPX7_EUPCR|nr:unnamed protein product [Moneuplotes crassus]
MEPTEIEEGPATGLVESFERLGIGARICRKRKAHETDLEELKDFKPKRAIELLEEKGSSEAKSEISDDTVMVDLQKVRQNIREIQASRKSTGIQEDCEMEDDKESTEKEKYKRKLFQKYQRQFSEYKNQLKPYNSQYEYTECDGYIQK